MRQLVNFIFLWHYQLNRIKVSQMASDCMKPLTGLLHLAVWCLLCIDDITTTGTESMVICELGPCGDGERFDTTTSVCSPCDQGSFMDRQNHKCLQCIPCIRPNQLEHEVVLRNCTATNDTEIGCDGLHYRTMLDDLPEPYCERCTECGRGQRVEQTCGPDSDTVCVEVDTTYDKDDSFNVSGNPPQLADESSSTSYLNTSQIYNDNAVANKRVSLTIVVVVLSVSIPLAVSTIIILTCKQRLRSISKTLPKLLYHRVNKNAGGSQTSLLEAPPAVISWS